MATDNSFTDFVNSELPKRLSTNIDPLSLSRGLMVVSTGVGLEVEFVPAETGNFGLKTDHNLPVDADGAFTLTTIPKGGVVLDTALLQLEDDSYVEIIGVQYTGGDTLQIPSSDLASLTQNIKGVTVTYLASLT